MRPFVIKSEELQTLSALAVIQQGMPAYFHTLRASKDVFVAVGAWCALLDNRQVPFALWDEAISLCRFPSVRRRAYQFFRGYLRDDLARKAALVPAADGTDFDQHYMIAELDFDASAAAAAEGQGFLFSGDITPLLRASRLADSAGGWRESLTWALRAAAIAPFAAAPMHRIYGALEGSARPDLLVELANLLISRNLHLQIAQIFLARAALMQKQPDQCLKKLAPFDDAKVAESAVLGPYLNFIRAMRAEAEERLGHFNKAYSAYAILNAAERDKSIDPTTYFKGVEIRAKLNIPQDLPAHRGPDVVQMLGFPRSGTTLLENVLAAHPAVETFEEIPALQVGIDRIERVLVGRAAPEEPRETFIGARNTYYDEIARRRRKPDATVLIDKMPIRTGDADLIARLFPEWRYIFAVRHPFDVVLSCFKQRFKPNPAMENFHTIAETARLYDFAMTEWFKRFTLDDPRVSYVRYDRLVTDFEATTRTILNFLGLEWNDSVVNFADAAGKRAANTPSYQKVRSGLSIGVQTYWRDYRFVFEGEIGATMRKLADFFGFETD